MRQEREAAGVAIEDLAGHTKLSRRMLVSLEAGEFSALPDQVFVRLFLRQYLEFVGIRDSAPWERALNAAWDRSRESSQSFVVVPLRDARSRRIAPWIITAVLVGATLIVLWRLEVGSHRKEPPAVLAAIPTAVAAPATASVTPPEPTPTSPPAAPSTAVTVETGSEACWVQVRFRDGRVAESLVPGGTTWTTEQTGAVAEIILGRAAGVTVHYAGRTYSGLGAKGEVVHLRPTESAEPE